MGRKVRLRRFTGPPRSWVETFQTVSLGNLVNRGASPSSSKCKPYFHFNGHDMLRDVAAWVSLCCVSLHSRDVCHYPLDSFVTCGH
jgi:hypothetical protein